MDVVKSKKIAEEKTIRRSNSASALVIFTRLVNGLKRSKMNPQT
jgi:hypothetical protein